jgi:hypothetical protein
MNDSNQSSELSYKTHLDASSATSSDYAENNVPIVYFGISVSRLVCLFVLTVGFYRFYWFYKNWKAVKEAEQSDISPFWRSFFAIFFCHELFEKIEESVKNYTHKKTFSSSSLSAWYIILRLLNLGILNLFILRRIQKAIHFNNKHIIKNYKPLKNFTRTELLCIIAGSCLWLFAIQRAIFESKKSTTTTSYITSWVTFQSANKDFKVRLPNHPTQEKEELPLGDGLSARYLGYESKGPKGVSYSVSSITYPSEIVIANIEPTVFLENIVETSSSNKLISSESIYIGKHKAIDFLIKNNFSYMKGRIIIVGQTRYLLMCNYLNSAYKERYYKRFINSFSLKSEH